MEKGGDSLLISLESSDEVLLERAHAVAKDANAVEKVADHDRLEHVEFELTVHARDGGSNVVTHDLSADHGERLTLGRVDLARHDGGTRLVFWQDELTKTAAGARSKVTNILGDLEKGASKSVKRAGSLDDGIMSSKNLKLVGRGLELGASQLANLLSNRLIETLESVQASANSSTTLGQKAKVGEAVLNTLDVAVELRDVSGELLAKGKRSGVLKVSSADLDDLLELLNLLLESISQALERWEKSLLEFEDSRNVHDGGERVVGRSGAVNVVIGMNRLLGSHLSTEDFNSTVRNDLVGVHVRLCAGTSLPDNQREVVHQLAGGNFSSGLLNSLSDRGICR